jgi:hypothetical protein
VEDTLKTRLILHDVKHFQECHELDTGKFLGNERVKIVAPLFTVGDDVHSGVLLEMQDFQHSHIGLPLKGLRAEAPSLLEPLGPQQLWWSRPAANCGDG